MYFPQITTLKTVKTLNIRLKMQKVKLVATANSLGPDVAAHKFCTAKALTLLSAKKKKKNILLLHVICMKM